MRLPAHHAAADRSRRPLQFGIRTLMLGVTASAVLLSLHAWTHGHLWSILVPAGKLGWLAVVLFVASYVAAKRGAETSQSLSVAIVAWHFVLLQIVDEVYCELDCVPHGHSLSMTQLNICQAASGPLMLGFLLTIPWIVIASHTKASLPRPVAWLLVSLLLSVVNVLLLQQYLVLMFQPLGRS